VIENSNISADSKPKLRTLQVVNQELRWVLLAKTVYNKKSHTSVVRYHTGGSMKLNARILHLAHMVYL
jgi:hypothetical protein